MKFCVVFPCNINVGLINKTNFKQFVRFGNVEESIDMFKIISTIKFKGCQEYFGITSTHMYEFIYQHHDDNKNPPNYIVSTMTNDNHAIFGNVLILKYKINDTLAILERTDDITEEEILELFRNSHKPYGVLLKIDGSMEQLSNIDETLTKLLDDKDIRYFKITLIINVFTLCAYIPIFPPEKNMKLNVSATYLYGTPIFGDVYLFGEDYEKQENFDLTIKDVENLVKLCKYNKRMWDGKKYIIKINTFDITNKYYIIKKSVDEITPQMKIVDIPDAEFPLNIMIRGNMMITQYEENYKKKIFNPLMPPSIMKKSGALFENILKNYNPFPLPSSPANKIEHIKSEISSSTSTIKSVSPQEASKAT